MKQTLPLFIYAITVVKYVYDAWGKLEAVTDANGNAITSSTHICNVNPIRYRSYYYDTETKLYYLQSRYYDPETCRFINIDNIHFANAKTINGLNLYAYCNNNPVMNVDPSGHFWNAICQWFVDVGTAIGNWFVDTGEAIGDWAADTWNGVKDWAVDTWNGVKDWAVDTWNGVKDWAINAWNTTKDFFVDTVWSDWIVDKTWNKFIVGTIWNRGLVPTWNWIGNNWKTVVDWVAGIGGIAISVVGILTTIGIFTIPVVGQIALGITSVSFGVWGVGRLAQWW